MVPKHLKIDFFHINNLDQVYRNAQRVQPSNSNNLCGNGTDFCKISKIAKISQNFIDNGHVYSNIWHIYSLERAMPWYF